MPWLCVLAEKVLVRTACGRINTSYTITVLVHCWAGLNTSCVWPLMLDFGFSVLLYSSEDGEIPG